MAEDEVARVGTERHEVAVVQFEVRPLVERNDVVDFEVFAATAGRTGRLALQMLTPDARPRAGAGLAGEEVGGVAKPGGEHRIVQRSWPSLVRERCGGRRKSCAVWVAADADR